MHVFNFTLLLVILSKVIYCNTIIHFGHQKLVFSSVENRFKKLIMNEDVINYNKFKLIQLKDRELYLNKVSGIVFESIEDSIFRIDKSYDDKMHTGSLDFVYNDTLFRFGGYGYFHTNKNLIYYDEKENEWDLINYKNFEKIQPFSTVAFHYVKDNLLYVVGLDNNISDLQQRQGFKRKGFVLNLKTKEIEENFEVNAFFNPPKSYIQIDQKHVFLFYPNRRELLILDTEDLNFYKYKLTQSESRINNEANENFVINNGTLYYTIKDIFEHNDIGKLNIEGIINNMKMAYNLKKNDFNYLPLILLILFPTLIIVLKKVINRPKTLVVEKMNLRYGQKSIPLNSKMLEVIDCLLKNKVANSNELNEFFYKKNQNLFHVNRKKNNCVDEINLLFKAKTNLDLIVKNRNEFDKRMVEYQINPSLR